jgi:hypothetical protein
MKTVSVILLLLFVSACGFARASAVYADRIPGPDGVTCYAIFDGDHVVGGNCVKN